MFWRHDPGRCPVDDCPHTTCVAPLTTDQTVTTPLARPGWLPARPVEPETVTFTTTSYKRREHGPGRPRTKR